MSDPIAFVDTETLGLDPDKHAIWEVGLILPDDTEYLWQLQLSEHQLENGDPVGMGIGGFSERYAQDRAPVKRERFYRDFVELTDGLHLGGAVVSFDEERLRREALLFGFRPGWHYHLVDVEAVAVGALLSLGIGVDFPWRSDQLSEQFGVTVSEEDRHTALGDARWAKRLYEAVKA